MKRTTQLIDLTTPAKPHGVAAIEPVPALSNGTVDLTDPDPDEIAISYSKNKRKNYCFTFNNYTPDAEKRLMAWIEANCTYGVFGHEVAPTTGTPHLQGYFSLAKPKSIIFLQRRLKSINVSLALIKARGSPKDNYTYCTKADPDNFYQFGEIKSVGQGARTDLNNVAQELRSHSVNEIGELYPVEFIKYHKGISELKKVYQRDDVPEDRDLTVTVLYGDSGTGKTLFAHTTAKTLGVDLYSLPNPNGGSIWFDDYCGQEALLIDDFYGWIKPHDLFKWLDRYRVQVPTKGSFVYARWKHVFITSNKRPQDWYKTGTLSPEMEEALMRRLHNVYQYLWVDGNKDETVTIKHKDEKEIFNERDDPSSEDLITCAQVDPLRSLK